MINFNTINSLIKEGENSRVEFKSAAVSNEDLAIVMILRKV